MSRRCAALPTELIKEEPGTAVCRIFAWNATTRRDDYCWSVFRRKRDHLKESFFAGRLEANK
jgi:hypothetical protein